MKHNKITGIILSVFTLLFFLTVPSFAVLDLISTTAGKSVAPRGSNALVMRIGLQSSGSTTETFQYIKLQNNGNASFYNGVKSVSIYQDTFSTSDTPIISKLGSDAVSSSEIELDLGNGNGVVIPTTNTVYFYIVYEIDTAAPLEQLANATISEIRTGGGVSVTLSGSTLSYSLTVSGFSTKTATDISPSVVVPGQTLVPMLRLTYRAVGEDVGSNVTITIQNDTGNFVTTPNATNGITKITLVNAAGISDYSLSSIKTFITNNPGSKLKELTASNMDENFTLSKTRAVFKFIDGNTFKFERNLETNLIVLYEIGNTTSVTENTLVKAQLISVTGTGATSSLTFSDTVKKPDTAVSVDVGGLSYTNVASIIPTNTTFGSNSIISMLQFELRAQHATLNLSQVTIKNTGTIGFKTGSSEGVDYAYIYLDQGDGIYSNIGTNADTLVGTLQMGTSNQADSARISLSSPVTVYPFDDGLNGSVSYPNNQARLFFVVYKIGDIDGTIPTIVGGANTKAALSSVTGNAVIDFESKDVALSGTLPASPNVSVNLSRLNIQILSIQDISPTSAVQGQVNVPMLSIKLNQTNTSDSLFNVFIENIRNSFTSLSNGVTAITLYKDFSPSTNQLTSNDTLLSKNTSLTDSLTASLTNANLSSGETDLLVFYDVGYNTGAGSNTISATLKNITSASGGSVLFGGINPNPQADLSVVVNPLTVTSITSTAGTASDLTTSFNVTIQVSNTSGSVITVTDIRPRFYFSNIAGKDISFEFKTVDPITNFTVNPNATVNKTFTVQHFPDSYAGGVVADAYVEYKVNPTGNAVLNRYRISATPGWQAIAPTPILLNIDAASSAYPWTLPGYIQSLTLPKESNKVFQNGNAMPVDSDLDITLKDGFRVPENQIQLLLNGQLQTDLDYNQETGVIRVGLGNQSGTISLTISVDNVAYEPATISFIISSSLEMSDVLFYPNPYKGSGPLALGLNLTKPASIKVSFINHLGRVVHERDFGGLIAGYNVVQEINPRDFLNSGMYFIKVVANDGSSKRIKYTKLAVY